MEFRDRVAKAKDTAVDTTSDAKEVVSKRTDGAKETAAETTETASAMVSTATGVVSERASAAGGRVLNRLPGRVNNGTYTEAFVGRLPSVSAERSALPEIRVRPALMWGSGRAAAVARGTDLRRVFGFGRNGFAYGKTFGDYVPVVGSYLPYVGFVTGIGVGVLDDIDVLSAEMIADRSASLSAALEQAVRRDDTDPTERSPGDADLGFEGRNTNRPREYLEMDFEEFAGKR